MVGNKNIKYLIPGSIEEGFLDEAEDNNAIFVVSYTDENDGDLDIKPSTGIDTLKKLPDGFRDDVLMVSNHVNWNNAIGFKLLGLGKAFKKQNDDKWISTKPIGVELLVHVSKLTENLYQNNVAETLYNNNDSEKKQISVVNTEVIVPKELSKISSFLSIEEQDVELVQRSALNSIVKRRIQYLKAGRSNDNFFFEGSSEDRTGASFSVQYNEGSLEGEFELIVDISNLRTMDVLFRKRVIKIINNGLLLKNSTSYIQKPHSGKVKFDTKNRVWIVVSPLVITLSN